MRLEPVSKRSPQHARSGARRATLHHIVVAVEEICGIVRIERHWCKPRKWRELRPRPLPTVPHEIVHAESASAWDMRPHRRRIPRFEIEVSPGRARCFLAPGVAPFLPPPRPSVPGTMKLGSGCQFTPKPLPLCGAPAMATLTGPSGG